MKCRSISSGLSIAPQVLIRACATRWGHNRSAIGTVGYCIIETSLNRRGLVHALIGASHYHTSRAGISDRAGIVGSDRHAGYSICSSTVAPEIRVRSTSVCGVRIHRLATGSSRADGRGDIRIGVKCRGNIGRVKPCQTIRISDIDIVIPWRESAKKRTGLGDLVRSAGIAVSNRIGIGCSAPRYIIYIYRATIIAG